MMEEGEWRTKVHVTDHPLVRTKLSIIRDRKTDSKVFRELVYEIGLYVGFQATSRLATNVEKNVSSGLIVVADPLHSPTAISESLPAIA